MSSRKPIPMKLRRRLLIEAAHRCAVCRHATVHIHHIIPWRECKEHKYSNLIALCPNCHDLADRGVIDKTTLRRHKVDMASSVIHEVCNVLFDPDKPFNEEWGPENYSEKQRNELILRVEQRKMLAGCLTTISWPLLRCDFCESLASIDNCWTPQEDCVCLADERIRVYCAFGCAERYQQMMRDFMAEQETPELYTGEYILQNSVEIASLQNKV